MQAARELNRAAAVLALSVLMDSAIEHYRGSFKNKAMFTPLAVSALALGVNAHGMRDQRAVTHGLRNGAYILTGLTGAAGLAFHAYNVMKRTGGINWQNLFYGAPIGAPAAIALSGALGSAGERIRHYAPFTPARIWGLPSGRGLAALTSLGILGTSAESFLLHFRGAFHNPCMYLPVTLPPIASALLARLAWLPEGGRHPLTRLWLGLTAFLGFGGVAFHAYGVNRALGGWRNWRQNMLDGPPLPAPPAFTGLSLAGLAALRIIEAKRLV